MFYERLNATRKLKGFTAQQMADSLSIALRSYRMYESGDRSPSLEMLVQIADILNTTRSYYGQYERGTRPFPIEHLITLCNFYKVSADYILGLPENLKFPKR